VEDDRAKTIGALDEDASAYVRELVRRARGVLPDLVGSYLIGSGALGDYVPGGSDVDVNLVVPDELARARKEELVRRVAHDALPCPAAKLELVVYRIEVLKQPVRVHEYELNLNTGRDLNDLILYDFRKDDPHWFVLDAAIARERGETITGPDISTLISEIPRAQIVEALRDSIAWHRAHEATYLTVLNACRSWRYAVEGTWVSKTEAARWASSRSMHRDLIEAALDARSAGRAGHVGPDATGRFLDEVLSALR
jgi:hypothetical protein